MLREEVATLRNILALMALVAPMAVASCAENSPGSHFARMSVTKEGHVGFTQEPRDDAGNEGYCTYLDTRRRTWGALAVPRPITTTSSAEDLLKAVGAEIGLGRAIELLLGERARVHSILRG
jgi:hypothetical protein